MSAPVDPATGRASLGARADVFVIERTPRRYRVLFEGGNTMDVLTSGFIDSDDRWAILEEAQRRWGGSLSKDGKKPSDWRIAAVTEVMT